MAVQWTQDQRKVIEHRNKNMLVSAAAGSGKTAVLVERILSLVTDEKHPVDLDRLLVVTFTRAAAAEMKERIRKSLAKKSQADPENEQLRRQSVLVHNAKISTIHSFCTWVIRNYFYTLDLDPMFRIMDEGEGRLMKADCMHALMTRFFEEEDREVLDFVLAYNSGKTTRGIETLLLGLYDTIIAQCWPEVYLAQAKEKWAVAEPAALEASPLMRDCLQETERRLREMKRQAEELLSAAQAEGGPAGYVPAFQKDLAMLGELLQKKTYRELQQAMAQASFTNLSSKKTPGEDPEIRSRVKQRRDRLKKELEQMQEMDFSVPEEELLAEIRFCAKYVAVLCRLLEEFDRSFAERKRRNNLMDYSDLEHFALRILVSRDAQGRLHRTEAAREIAAGLAQVMTDEYQDSNEIQEAILWSVSGQGEESCNRFMVGDIKQSIYGFRHARPEIFLEKLDAWRNEPGCSEVIDLQNNYRSRPEVVGTVNLLFQALMSRRLGGTDYDETQRLYAAGSFGPAGLSEKDETIGTESKGDYRTEILFLDRKDPDFENEKNKEEALQAEALLVAGKIRELRKSLPVWDRENNTCRPLRYSDCVILLRSAAETSDLFQRVLTDAGIPATAMSRTGYFSAVEVQLVLNYLRILDNPLQDIPFASVLFSAFAGCSAQELAQLRIAFPEGRLCTAARLYCGAFPDSSLSEKLRGFFAVYDDLAGLEKGVSVRTLLDLLYDKTQIRSYAAAMPGGAQRAANLDLLLQKAGSFEQTSYSGLFDFIRYIEELEKAREDFGQAGLFSEQQDAVRILTIHKSKGLEFPVVFLCGCTHGFNRMDQRGQILTHRELGIGLDAVDTEAGKRKKSFFKGRIAAVLQREMLSEELRILYVALTRAKEKLVLTVVAKDLEAMLQKSQELRPAAGEAIPDGVLQGASCYADWILPVLSRDVCMKGPAAWAGMPDQTFSEDCGCIRTEVVTAGSLTEGQKERRENLKAALTLLPDRGESRIYDAPLSDLLSEIGGFVYPYAGTAGIPEKISVSDLKRMHLQTEEEDPGTVQNGEEEIFPYIPAFMQEEEAVFAGAARGTAYHTFWKLLDYTKLPDPETWSKQEAPLRGILREMLQAFAEGGHLTKEEAACISLSDMEAFLCSELGRRFYAADRAHELVREQPFTVSLPARSADPAWQSDEPVLVQGVIDAYFREGDGYVLVDYKTDRVSDETGAELIAKYEKQLRMYAWAIEHATGKNVKEKMIYSTDLKKCVILL